MLFDPMGCIAVLPSADFVSNALMHQLSALNYRIDSGRT